MEEKLMYYPNRFLNGFKKDRKLSVEICQVNIFVSLFVDVIINRLAYFI